MREIVCGGLSLEDAKVLAGEWLLLFNVETHVWLTPDCDGEAVWELHATNYHTNLAVEKVEYALALANEYGM